MNKLDQNKEFFEKNGFKRMSNPKSTGGYYYSKEVADKMLSFNHKSNDKGVLSDKVCVVGVFHKIQANIAGFQINSMPVRIMQATVNDIEQEYESFLNYFQLRKIITK